MEPRLKEWLRPVLGPGTTLDAAAAACERHQPLLARFECREAPALFCYTDAGGDLHMSLSIPQQFQKLLYVLQEPGGACCGSDSGNGAATSISGILGVGYLEGSQALRQVQDLVEGLYVPQLHAAGRSWPEQLRHDYAGQLNSFCSALTEAVHAQEDRTVLYVPAEEVGDVGLAARQAELVQRLEVQLLQWTQQIRGVLNCHRTREHQGHEEGPAEEVAFWRLRTADLGYLRDQLDGAALGRVLRVLEAAKSLYLPAFLSLRGSIQQEAEQAASNLAFLEALEAPCTRLASAQPAQMAAVLPEVLDALRMVWSLAPHYSSAEQMVGMLRKVGNAVVARCCSTLDLSSIFGGQGMGAAVQSLEQCCTAAADWRSLYAEAAQRVSAALPQRPWSFDAAAIFAHVDAFVQRCRDLQELCAAQQQFACGPQVTAALSGSKAPETVRAIGEVQQAFAHHMSRLHSLQYDMLDVRCGQWSEDMAAFRSAVRDQEQMLGNILAVATSQAASLTCKLDVIEAFAQITTRDGLRKVVEARLSDWHHQFQAELASAKQSFEGIKAELLAGPPLPAHSGRVLLLRGVRRRIEHTWDHLSALSSHIPVVPKAAESAAAYEALHTGLQQCINNLNIQWYGGVPQDIAPQLNQNLLYQDKAAGGLLRINLSPQLQQALEEAYLFERQRMGVPPALAALLPDRQRLRALWVGMVQVCRAYNQVLGGLSAEDRRLCRDRLRFLDRHVLPGVNKLSWASPKHQTDFYCKDVLRCCKEVSAAVGELQGASTAVAATCTLFRETLLVQLERRRCYNLPDFEQHQAAHRATVCTKMCDAYTHMRAALVSLYRRFAADSEEVQQEWLVWLRRADLQVQEALTACVRRSLHELARTLRGEQKGAEPSPVFVLHVVLDTTTSRVELNPTLQQLFDTVHGTCKAAVSALEALPRLLPEVLSGCAAAGPLPPCLREVEAPPPFVDVVGKDEEAVTKHTQAITQGIRNLVEKVQQLLTFHEKKYMMPLWQTDCTAYMRRYERANKPAAAFQADISKYMDLKEEVLSEDAASNVRWLRLDCSTLKQQLAALCDNWMAAFSGLLASMASRQLAGLHEELHHGIAELAGQAQVTAMAPGGLVQEGGEPAYVPQQAGAGTCVEAVAGSEAEAECGLSQPVAQQRAAAVLTPEQRQQEAVRLEEVHRKLEEEREEMRQRVAACQEKYNALVHLQVSIPDEELERVDQLPALWQELIDALDGVPTRLRELLG